jgi:hypothetical protein
LGDALSKKYLVSVAFLTTLSKRFAFGLEGKERGEKREGGKERRVEL